MPPDELDPRRNDEHGEKGSERPAVPAEGDGGCDEDEVSDQGAHRSSP